MCRLGPSKKMSKNQKATLSMDDILKCGYWKRHIFLWMPGVAERQDSRNENTESVNYYMKSA